MPERDAVVRAPCKNYTDLSFVNWSINKQLLRCLDVYKLQVKHYYLRAAEGCHVYEKVLKKNFFWRLPSLWAVVEKFRGQHNKFQGRRRKKPKKLTSGRRNKLKIWRRKKIKKQSWLRKREGRPEVLVQFPLTAALASLRWHQLHQPYILCC